MASETVQPRTCATCKSESRNGIGYVAEGNDHYCPACFPKRQAHKAKWSLLPIVVVLLYGWLITFSKPPTNQMGWLLINVYCVVLLQMACILPHELGHALVGHWLGKRVYQVVVGVGPTLWKRPFLGGTIDIRLYPFVGGHTISVDRRVAGFRIRKWISILGGPLVNVVLLAVCIPLLPRPHPFKALILGFAPATAFFLANAMVLLWNLFPWKVKSTMGVSASDGLNLLVTPFLKEEEVRNQAALYYVVLGSVELAEKRYEAARRLHEEGLREFPESLLLRNDLAVAKLRLGDAAGAREEFLTLAAAGGKEPQLRLLALNNVASTYVYLSRPELLEEADRCSRESMESLSWIPSVKGTRAAILVELGRFDEGLALARSAMDGYTEDEHKAYTVCTMALAFHGKGEAGEALKSLEQAVRLDPANRRLAQVRQRLGIPVPGSGTPQ